MAADPYRTLGVTRSVSDEELRRAYRRLVQRHHPDHNGGSAESARRFEEIQAAYAEIRDRRAAAGARPTASGAAAGAGSLDERLAQLEFELREAQRGRERRLREAREQRERIRAERERLAREAERSTAAAAERAAAQRAAARGAQPDRDARASRDEELGRVSTDDSFGAILRDARDELTERFSHAREHPVVKRVSDLIDGLDGLASQLDGRDKPPRRGR